MKAEISNCQILGGTRAGGLIWFQLNYCVRGLQKVPIFHIFNTPFLSAAAKLSTLHRLGTCRELPKCGQLVHVLRKGEVPLKVRCFNVDFSSGQAFDLGCSHVVDY